MNLMLHEVDRPAVVRGNTLAFELKDQRTDGVDVILTNPPFGGEEETTSSTFPDRMHQGDVVVVPGGDEATHR